VTECEEDEACNRQKQISLTEGASSTGLSLRVDGRLQPRWSFFFSHEVGLELRANRGHKALL